jgi:putative transposase
MVELRRCVHVVFRIYLHIVFGHKRKILTQPMLEVMKPVFQRVLLANRSYLTEFHRVYWGKAKLWHDSKCIVFCGGAPLEIVKQYIQNQSGSAIHPHCIDGGEFRTFS